MGEILIPPRGTDLADPACYHGPFRCPRKASTNMSQNSPQDGIPPATNASSNPLRLDPEKFEAFAKAAKQAVAEGLVRRALMAQKPPTKAKH